MTPDTDLLAAHAAGDKLGRVRAWEEFDFDTVIPGHGAVTNPDGLRTYHDNVVGLRNRVSELIGAGRSQEQIGEVLGAEYPAYSPGSLDMEWSLPGFMTELR